MSYHDDNVRGGYWPLQHHGYKKITDLELRAMRMAYRIINREIKPGQFGHWVVDHKSVGDVILGLLWPNKTGKGGRAIPAWGWGWPTITQKGSKGLPIKDDTWTADERFKELDLSTPPGTTCVQKYPNEIFGITLDGSDEDRQDQLFFSLDGRLICVNFAGDPDMGSIVADLDADDKIDPDRCVRIQSNWRITTPRKGCLPIFNNKDNCLAWQLRASEQDGLLGHGAYYANVGAQFIKALTKGPNDQNCGIGVGIPVGVRAQGQASWNMSGQWHPGWKDDKHQLGETGDGEQIHSGHNSTLAYYSNPNGGIGDGPLDFEELPPPKVSNPKKWHRVHLRWDCNPVHDFVCGPRDGKWRWYGKDWCHIPEVPPDEPPPWIPWEPPTDNVPPPRDDWGDAHGGGFEEREKEPNDLREVPLDPIMRELLGEMQRKLGGGGSLTAKDLEKVRRLAEKDKFIDRKSRPPTDWVAPGFQYPEKTEKRSRNMRPKPYVTGTSDHAGPGILARPTIPCENFLDMRYVEGNPDLLQEDFDAILAQHDKLVPITARLDAFGNFRKGQFVRNEKRGTGRYVSGTADGGWVLLAAEIDVVDFVAYGRSTPATDPYPFPRGRAGFIFGEGAYMGFGSLSKAGDVHSGYEIVDLGDGTLLINQVDADSIRTELVRFRPFGTREVAISGLLEVTQTDITKCAIDKIHNSAAGAVRCLERMITAFTTDMGDGDGGRFKFTASDDAAGPRDTSQVDVVRNGSDDDWRHSTFVNIATVMQEFVRNDGLGTQTRRRTGRRRTPITFGESPFSLLATHDVLHVDASGGTVIVNLPSNPTIDTSIAIQYTIAKIAGSAANKVDVTAGSGDTILGAAFFRLNNTYDAITIHWNAVNRDWVPAG